MKKTHKKIFPNISLQTQ